MSVKKKIKKKKANSKNPKATVFLGSDSDIPKFEKALTLAETLGISLEIKIASAHRSPAFLLKEIRTSEAAGTEVFIAGAGAAAHLGGVIASHTFLPVIGVPIDSSPLQGLDSLLATAMMPSGIPVATMAIGSAGASNAVVFASEILAIKYPTVKKHLLNYKKSLANSVKLKNAKLNR
jgi:phosphoribosylaminoimidazole carboxylase PurE protein